MTNCEYVFVSSRVPYQKLRRSACGRGLQKILKKLKFNCNSYGFHITRRTFATNVLKHSHDISKTAAVLGHSGNDNVSKYINLDHDKMKLCGLHTVLIPYGGIEL